MVKSKQNMSLQSVLATHSASAEIEKRSSWPRSTGSNRSKLNGDDLACQFEDAVKFDPIIPDTSEAGSVTGAYQDKNIAKDETLLLFDCMPKGLESFLETGPSRRVVDYMDYETLCAIQRKKIDYLKEQEKPQTNRAKDIFEKSLELQEHLKNFDMFVSEAQKKRERAGHYYISCKNANRDLDIEIPRAYKKLNELKQVRDGLKTKVIKYQPVDDFIERVIRLPDSQFLNFNAIMDRSSTLLSTNRYLAKRFAGRHIVQNELSEELQAINNACKTHDIFIRREINRLKKELQALTRTNMDLEQNCNTWCELTTDKLMNIFLMNASIKNMARLITRVRPFTAKSLDYLTNPCDIVEKVGSFITNYTGIVNGTFIIEPKNRKKIVQRTSSMQSFIPNAVPEKT